MKQTKIYISGKISGLEKSEYEKNFIGEKTLFFLLNDVKYSDILIPTQIKPLFGIKSYWFYMIADIYHEIKCTHVAFQKNWIDSKGARIEMIVALITNKKIIML